MTNRTPHHLEARLQRALADVKQLARDRGLDHAFDLELFGLEHDVQAALDAHARGLAEHAAEAIRRLARQLSITDPKVTTPEPASRQDAARGRVDTPPADG